MERTQKLSGWANFPVIEAAIVEPKDEKSATLYVQQSSRVIARGNGKSYGDAALGKHVLSTLALAQIRHFDPSFGIIECQAGTLLSSLLRLIIPHGWFFQVTPGIKHITVGGAIATDVHGKNHPTKGCFSDHLLSFELLTANGEILSCSRLQHPQLFWLTCGGMGWTGVILSARFQLMRINTAQLQQKTVQCQHLDAIFQVFEDNKNMAYAAGWIDTTASGKTFGRGAVHLAEHLAENGDLIWKEKKTVNIPMFAPSWSLNSLTIKAFNHFYYTKNASCEKDVGIDDYFYPLDAIQNWNRLYGRRGFVQYQFCLPEQGAFSGMVKILEAIKDSRETPFLSVLKRHGDRTTEAVNSFPIKGYSLALDFPRTHEIFGLVRKLDEMIWAMEGKIYLAKDACSHPKMGRVDFRAFPEVKFWSAMRERFAQFELL